MGEAVMLAMKTILYATDFSADARPAFEVACTLAGDKSGRLVILHVERPPLATLGGTTAVPLSKRESSGLILLR
jgi:nucleotide-binding universal stress UspA family protein